MAVDVVRLSDVEEAHDFCFSHAREVLPEIKQAVFENTGHNSLNYDLITPLERGKEWTFNFISKYQPRTARQLLGGSEFKLMAELYGSKSHRHRGFL